MRENPAFVSDLNEVGLTVTEELLNEHLQGLFVKKDTLAIMVPKFVSEDEGTYIAENVERNKSLTSYIVEPDFAKLGFPWYEANSDERREEYLATSDTLMEAARAVCSPFPSPVEQLHLLLDRKWKAGASIQRIAGRPMYYGLPRVLKSGGEVEPHQDVLAWDSPNAPGIEGYRGQAAGNIYLKMSDCGGELALWSRSYPREKYEALRIPDSYGIFPAKIGPPALVIRPAPGSLILFDSTRVHAVYEASGGVRVSFSTFIGYFGPNRPLTLWS